MASTSTAPSFSLPSIHEMFPEHLLPRTDRTVSRPSVADGLKPFASTHHRSEPSRSHFLSAPQQHPSRTTHFDHRPADHYQVHGPVASHSTNYSGVDRTSGPGYHISGARTHSPLNAPSLASMSAPLAVEGPRGSHNYPTEMSEMYKKDQPHHVQQSSSMYNNPSVIAFPSSGSGPNPDSHLAEDSSNFSDGENPSEPGSGKKHICPTCFKRFNRPSSLRIHVNTHTGATPFRCPWPGCGREFNVNSNMRRHYRNHSTPGYTRPNGDTRRRRRRNVDPSIVDPNHLGHMVDPSQLSESTPGGFESDGYESDYSKSQPNGLPDYARLHASYEKGYPSHRRQGSSSSTSTNGHYGGPPPIPHQYQYPPPPARHPESGYQQSSPRHHPYPSPDTRSYTPGGSSFHSSSPSPSPSPPLPSSSSAVLTESHSTHKDPTYSASIPYLRTVTDARAVSTTLRPAFESPAPVPRSAAVRHSYAGNPSHGW